MDKRHPRLLTREQADVGTTRCMLRCLAILLAPVVVPLRLVGALFVIGVYSLILYQYVGVAMGPKEYERYHRILLQPFKIVLGLLGIQVRVKGEIKAYIVISNHYSTLDVLALVSSGIGSFIAKAGVGKVKLLQPYLCSMNCLFARDGRHASAQLMQRYGRRNEQDRARSADAEAYYPPIAIFAQGTTTCQDCYCKFRTGAFLPMANVQICRLRYQSVFELQAMIGSPFRHFLLLLTNLFGIIEVEYMDVVTADGCEDAESFRGKCEVEYGKATGLRFCDYFYSDLLWFSETVTTEPHYDYLRDFGYMGTFSQWKKRCAEFGVDRWTQPECIGTLIV